ncbi:DUF4440 domain-containing protein [Caenorhabditis elegans]|uniref:DUF4440 domain-containing protein n=1 Tax=Caenorhabditis elegans TaxID=6239 RepID=Q18465_CAEEL|nr:DUF4440 domain-containing protein [Caenorhabditis elegans]CCD65823.1 DUF4440 domain-containing protein [Caenorhabditis elegans]|eukprot:NP_494976.1 Uncharacterized protein CELE_C34F11.2 [Caenorhabditis elegans]
MLVLRLFNTQKARLSQLPKASNEIVKDFISKLANAAGSRDKLSDCFTHDFQFFGCGYTVNKAPFVEKHLATPNPEPLIPKCSSFNGNDSKISFTASHQDGPRENIVDLVISREEKDSPWRLQSGKITNCP